MKLSTVNTILPTIILKSSKKTKKGGFGRRKIDL